MVTPLLWEQEHPGSTPGSPTTLPFPADLGSGFLNLMMPFNSAEGRQQRVAQPSSAPRSERGGRRSGADHADHFMRH